MNEPDLILSSGYTPTFEEIANSIEGPAAALWADITACLTDTYQSKPKIMFSRCSGKPGWNVKYQKSGKSLCTLYPERHGFIALVVIALPMAPEILAFESDFTGYVVDLVKAGKPYNGTLWLMIRVAEAEVLEDVKRLLRMKLGK